MAAMVKSRAANSDRKHCWQPLLLSIYLVQTGAYFDTPVQVNHPSNCQAWQQQQAATIAGRYPSARHHQEAPQVHCNMFLLLAW